MSRIRSAPPLYFLGLIVVLFFIGLPTVVSSFQSSEWTQVLIFAIVIMGLNILVGYSGQISLGHGALMAVGAYTSAILIPRYQVDYLITIPIAGLLTGLVGFVLGIPALRLSALYLALATFALAVVAPSLIKRPVQLTGGVQGILLTPPDPPQFAKDAFAAVTGGLDMTSDQWIYYVSLILALLLFWLAWNLVRHRPGRAMRAIRDREVAAAASGINVAAYKTMAFGISAFYAGIGGALYGLSIGFVSPDTFPLALSFQLLVGGIFTFWLPIVSSQFVASQPWIPTGIAAAFKNAGPQVTYGALLIVIMIFAPNGVVGLVTVGYARLQARLRGAGDRGSGQMPSDPQTV